MYCKFKDGDLVMVKRDTKSFYGACVRKWVCGTVVLLPVEITKDGRYVRVRFGKVPGNGFNTLIPIKDLKKISDKKIPKGSYSTPRFNNGDHVVYKGKTRFLDIEGWVVDNKPYYNECKIVIRTQSGNHMLVNECDTRTIYEYRYFDTEVIPKHLLNSVYGMTYREFEYCVNDVAVMMNLKKHEQKLKEASKMKEILDDNHFITFSRKGDTVTANLYETTIKNSDISACKIILGAEAKCHPDDKFNYKTGMMVALEKLEGKWRLMNKSNLQKFKDGELWVKTDKENFIDFMAICARRDISWPEASALGWIPNGLINGRPIYVKVDPETGYMFYQSYPLDSKLVITVSELLK